MSAFALSMTQLSVTMSLPRAMARMSLDVFLSSLPIHRTVHSGTVSTICIPFLRKNFAKEETVPALDEVVNSIRISPFGRLEGLGSWWTVDLVFRIELVGSICSGDAVRLFLGSGACGSGEVAGWLSGVE